MHILFLIHVIKKISFLSIAGRKMTAEECLQYLQLLQMAGEGMGGGTLVKYYRITINLRAKNTH